MIKSLVCVVMLICLAVPDPVSARETPPRAVNGVLDLTSWDFSGENYVPLVGEWRFKYNHLGSLNQVDPELITVPSLWNELEESGYTGRGYATYDLLIKLPVERPPTMAIELPSQYSAFRLYTNGKLFHNSGVVARNKKNYQPRFLPNTRTLVLGEVETLRLRVEIANYDHRKGGFGKPLILGNTNLFHKRVLHFSLDIFLAGCLIMGGLFFLGLYLFGNQSKPILFFALFCIVWGYRIIASGLYALHTLIDINWYVAMKLEYTSMFLAGVFFILYVHYLLPKDFTVWARNLLVGCLLCFTTVVLFTNPEIFTQTVNAFIYISLLAFIAILFAHVRSLAYNRLGSLFGMISTLAILFVFGYFFLQYLGVIRANVLATFVGSLVFVFLQSLVLSFRYSTELKQAKTDAEQASVAKTEFLSTMSHEIRTPLNAVVGLSNYLIEENPRKDQRESLTNLKFASENLLSLINDILDYNKIDAGKIDLEEKPFNIHRLLESTVAAYRHIAEEKGIEISYNIENNIPGTVKGDITRLNQVLTNLIGNAIKFTKEGYVEVSLNLVARTDNQVAIKFLVQDTGVGIAADKQKLIFQSFTQASSSTTREFGGSGLGLAITDKLLELMGSRLSLRSEEGEGSLFYFILFLEVAGETVPEKKVDLVKNTADLSGKRVLVVEDTPINIMVARKFLEKWGMQVDEAENGQVAVKMVQENSYDVILMDLQMPVMDGYEATRHLREMQVTTPIIALTAAAVTEIIEKVETAGMNGYVTKPFNPTVLHDKMIENLK